MQQQLREDLQYYEAEVQRLKDMVASFQESCEKVKEAAGQGERSKAKSSVRVTVQRRSGNGRSSME